MSRLILMLLFACPIAALASSEPPGDLPRPDPVPVPVGPDFVPTQYCGKVTGITKTAITIKLQGSLKIESLSFHPDGKLKQKQVYVQDNDQPPKEFVIHERLFPRDGIPVQRGHAITDTRVGDIVHIGCHRALAVDLCIRIDIYRRPGGKVPPAAGDTQLSAGSRWDTRRNAEQAAEEKAAAMLRRFGRSLFR